MNLCVYCSSYENLNPEFFTACETFGHEIARRGHTLIYGGYNKGIMGAVAGSVAKEGGKIIAVVPKLFDTDDFMFEGCTEVIHTEDIRERKEQFELKSDAFVVLPGGVGTMDELFDTMALINVGELEKKPIAILNVRGCYDHLEGLLRNFVKEGFLFQRELDNIRFYNDVSELIDGLEKK